MRLVSILLILVVIPGCISYGGYPSHLPDPMEAVKPECPDISGRYSVNGSSYSSSEKITRISEFPWMLAQDMDKQVRTQYSLVSVKSNEEEVNFVFSGENGSEYSVSDRVTCKWPWILLVRNGSPDYLLSKDMQNALVIAQPLYNIVLPVPIAFKKWETWYRYPEIN